MTDGDEEAEEPAEAPDSAADGATDADTDTDTQTDAEEEPDSEPEGETEPAPESESESEAETEPDPEELDVETLEAALDEVATELEAAETEADLDAVEDRLDDVAADIERADLPEPDADDEDDEDAADPRGELEDRVEELRAALEEARGPYATDVVAAVEDQTDRVRDTRWTEEGHEDVAAAVRTFVATASETTERDFEPPSGDAAALAASLETASEAVEAAGLDPDADAAAIEKLLTAAAELETGLDDAQEWDDLSVRAKLRAEGFYEAMGGKHKDFPPEWSALKGWEQQDDVEMVLLALEMLGSEFMERHCLEALERMGNPESIDAMLERAERRDKHAIRILGNCGVAREDVVETLVEFVGTDSDPALERVTMKALGEMGATDAVQAVADRLVAEDETVRSAAARALGLLGDPRAVAPLADVLAEDDVDSVRASAAWGLVQVGTEAALEAAADHADDRAFVVQAEAETAAAALEDGGGRDAAPAA